MKLRTQKLICFFLEALEKQLKPVQDQRLSDDILHILSDDDLRKAVLWLYPKTYSQQELLKVERHKLVESLNSESNLLLWLIDSLEKAMTARPCYCQKTIDHFFEKTQNHVHYLASKPITIWDEYDHSNYRHLLWKSGTITTSYAVYSADVEEEDKYCVDSPPKEIFDTHDEAQRLIEQLVCGGGFTDDELKIMSYDRLQ